MRAHARGRRGATHLSALARARDWWFRDRRTGAITVAQWPNAPLVMFGLCAGADWAFAPAGPAGTVLRGVGLGALVVWAVDEVARGVNPWRRCLGGGVLVGLALRWTMAAMA